MDELALWVSGGPLEGERYEVGAGLTIGRSEDCDVLLAFADVSRAHARIVPLAGGGLGLTDLGSTNGTWVAGRRVAWERLDPGSVFSIGVSSFSVERHREHDPSTTYAVLSPRVAREQGAAPSPDAPAPAYQGDLLEDVVQLRALRVRCSNGQALDPIERRRHQELETLLGRDAIDPNGELSFERSARVRLDTGAECNVAVQSLGVRSAWVLAKGLMIAPGRALSLAIPAIAPKLRRTAVFGARVTAADGAAMRLAFAGTAVWASVDAPRSRTRTARLPDPPLARPEPDEIDTGETTLRLRAR